MKFTVNRQSFIKKLNDVSRAISTKTTIPILTGLKLEVTSNEITFTGSDTDISIETTLRADDENAELNVEEAGNIVLPARFFGEIVKRLPEATMTVAVKEGFQANITSGAAAFTINGLDANSYPHLPEIESDDEVTLAGDVFRDIINTTVIAVSNQESRPILTGVHFTLAGDQFTAVATDSHRLSQRKITLPTPATETHDVIIPGKSLVELSRMIGEDSTDVKMRLAENQVLFLLGDTSFYSRLLEGNYPDTSRLIPSESDTTMEISAPTLLSAIERASLLSHESRNNVVKITLKGEEKSATIFGNSPDVGAVEENLSAISLEGSDLEISFNPDYLKDALRSFGQSQIKLSFTSALRPFTLVPSEDEQNFIQLITPVRTF
ncbi:DNA polymerase III beta subunit [Furfurilactobacillus rossiae]|uniref:DNA polymerase III subunit beta n=1 Tax=Furfurilactobacillus rossiae TaxID=231049 RepID=UPI0015BE854B|nr:DNA polymerase III subunit beta [Furfurilactobacillus rossiae]MCF6165164.1 DNA polymerase III subunit beta [Furfurilactobacillus rossiae]QLE62822.1 DNA polymerase III beta subunit [Furfurilactobacillus rossiae]